MLIVQKYGGTSVGTVERIQAVARRVAQTAQTNQVVVVVSAMGKTTDGLVKLAQDISPHPNRREMDMLLSTGEQVTIALLSMALQEIGCPAISLTGAQVGIVTEAKHTRARILEIQTNRLERHLGEGKVIVVAGFQGVTDSDDLEITTLGRGGSDTTAVALASALHADKCEIYTDVPGILTTDPRLVPDAQLMKQITADEMLELASLGAKVLHPRAVEIARNYGVPLVVLSSWTDDPGTLVFSANPQRRPISDLELAKPVDAVEFDPQQAPVSLLHVPDCPGVASRLFGGIAAQNIDVDLIIQSIHAGNTNDIAFTVKPDALNQALAIASELLPTLATNQPSDSEPAEVKGVDRQVAKISIVGAGMIGRPKVASQMFTALAEAQVNILMISTSEVKISCVIDATDSERAKQALCETFQVDVVDVNNQINPATEQPPVSAVALDLHQARLAVRHVPDQPGMAAKIFSLLADENISIDMIIQSQRLQNMNDQPTRDIAFTVAVNDAETAQSILNQAASQYGWSEVNLDRAIAKVSVVGSGMIAHPGVAAKMFNSLSQQGINILMIATSEIKISCVVEQEQGVKALQAIHEAFGLSGETKVVVPA
jgi:aspartate kinase